MGVTSLSHSLEEEKNRNIQNFLLVDFVFFLNTEEKNVQDYCSFSLTFCCDSLKS